MSVSEKVEKPDQKFKGQSSDIGLTSQSSAVNAPPQSEGVPQKISGFAYSGGLTHQSGREGHIARLTEKSQALLFGTAAYRWSLWHPITAHLSPAPPIIWYGTQKNGQALLDNRYIFAGYDIQSAKAPWIAPNAPPEFLAELHNFQWLADLNMIGGDTARYKARELTAEWISHYGDWSILTWRADILAKRLIAWLSHYQSFFESADAFFQKQLIQSCQQQLRHLSRITPGTLTGLDLLSAIKALCLGGYCLSGQTKLIEKSQILLETWIRTHVLADGGYLERCPQSQAHALKDLIDLKTYLQKIKGDVPQNLQNAIDRMTPVLRFYRMGDGDLAHFNDSREVGVAQITDILNRADAAGKAPESLPHTGFQRIIAGKTVILMDVGHAAPEGHDGRAAAGTLSFEMSYGGQRLIVNCGTPRDSQNWGQPATQIYQGAQTGKIYCKESVPRHVWRATAAHSTLTLNDTNSTEIYKLGGVGRKPADVSCQRVAEDACVLLETSQDGYIPLYGLTHYRHLFVDGTGADFRGEDRLSLAAGAQMSDALAQFMRENPTYSKHGLPSWPFDIRFHLHPMVKLCAQDQDLLSLQLPDASIWEFRQSGAQMNLAESAYYDGSGTYQKTWQIRLSGKTRQQPESLTFARVKWAFKRVSS